MEWGEEARNSVSNMVSSQIKASPALPILEAHAEAIHLQPEKTQRCTLQHSNGGG
jgi:hypothetical protein